MARRVKIAILNSSPTPAMPSLASTTDVMQDFWAQKLAQVLPDQPDLLVLPEFCDLWSDGTAERNLEYCAERGDVMRKYFQAVAKSHRCYLAYPTLWFCEDGTRRNRMLILDRDGNIAGHYDKNYITIQETEEYGILPGTKVPLIECDFGTVCGAICFDLNFDQLRLQVAALQPDLILFSSLYHGGLMQSYWAYSCRAFFAASVARLPSAVVSPIGQELATTTNYFDFVTTTINLDRVVIHLDYNAPRLTALKAKYGPEVSISDPGLLGSVLVSSEPDEVCVSEMVREFEIELLDDYLARARGHQEFILQENQSC